MPESGSRHGWAWLAVGVALSVLLFWWAVRGLEVGRVLDLIGSVPSGPVLLSVALATLSFPLRLLRWRALLREPDGAPLRAGPGWHAIAIGFMGNNVLPFRAGEVIRAYVASRLAPVKWTGAFASIAVERVFDALTIVAFLTAALLLGDLPAGTEIAGVPAAALARRVGLAGLGGLGLGALLLLRPELPGRVIRALIPVAAIADRLVLVFDGVREGLTALSSPGRLLAVAWWSIAVWGVTAASFLALFAAFDLPLGPSASLVLLAIVIFGIAIPSSPGFIGVFEAAIVFALGLYGVPQDIAFAYAVLYHVTTFLPITVMGMYSVVRTPLQWREVREHRL